MPRPTSYAVFCLKKKRQPRVGGHDRLHEHHAALDLVHEAVALGLFVRPLSCFFFNDTATTEIYTLSLHDALPILYAQETLTFLLTQKKTCVKNYVQKE